MTPDNAYTAAHNPAASRFEVVLPDGQFAVVDYRLTGNTLTIYHTGVPSAFEGQGIAAIVTKATLDWAKGQGYRVEPVCSYTRAYLQRHPEYQVD